MGAASPACALAGRSARPRRFVVSSPLDLNAHLVHGLRRVELERVAQAPHLQLVGCFGSLCRASVFACSESPAGAGALGGGGSWASSFCLALERTRQMLVTDDIRFACG